jgi:hypothetical protein
MGLATFNLATSDIDWRETERDGEPAVEFSFEGMDEMDPCSGRGWAGITDDELDGWGIHMSLRGGWVWNLWGRNCVVLRLRKSILRVGTDDAVNLVEFLNARLVDAQRLDNGKV